jgi:hypothetical protein
MAVFTPGRRCQSTDSQAVVYRLAQPQPNPGGHEAIRLPDRAVRQGLSNYHKRVDLIESRGDRRVVITITVESHRPLYEGNLAALNRLAELGVEAPSIISLSRADRELTVTYAGPPTRRTSFAMRGAIRYLAILNNRGPRVLRASVPRYVWRTAQILSAADDPLRKDYESLISMLSSPGLWFEYGPGFEDPAPTNFTHRGPHVCMVDFDHYSEDVNLHYEIGFLLAGCVTDAGHHVMSFPDLAQVTDHWLGLRLFHLTPDDRFQLLLGYLSLLSTLVWDAHQRGGAALERFRLYRPDIRLVLSELLHYFRTCS